MLSNIIVLVFVVLLIGFCLQIGEAIGACVGDYIKYRYALWKIKKGIQ